MRSLSSWAYLNVSQDIPPLGPPAKLQRTRMAYTERDSLLVHPHAHSKDTQISADHLDEKQLGPLEISSKTRSRILVGIWLAQFLSALNLTLVPTMVSAISSDFNKSNQASWLGTSYLLATCTFTPLYGRLSDAMGRRGASQSAILFAAAGILACGSSTNMNMLVLSRFMSGIGGGGIFTTSAIITSDMYTLRARGFVQSIAGIFYGLGMGLGGPIGGLVTDWLGWRWAFLVQVPLFALSAGLVIANLNYVTPGKQRSSWEVLKRIDYLGSLTLFCGVAFTLLFLSKRYNEDLPWSDTFVWTFFLAAISSFGLFILVEMYLAVEPVLAHSMLTQKVPILVGWSNALVAVCNLSITYFFPLWFQTVMMTSASTAGLHLLPNSLCISTGSVFAGWMMRRLGRYKVLTLTFGALPLLASILLTQLRETSSEAHKWLTIMPLGFGNAVVLQTMYIALVSHLPNDQMAIGTGFSQLFRGIGQVGGLAAASAVFQSSLGGELQKRITGPEAEQIIRQVRHSARLVTSLPLELQRPVRDAYAASLKNVFTLAAGASLLAYLSRLLIPDKDLNEECTPTPPVESGDDNASMYSVDSSGYETDDEGKGKNVSPARSRC